MVFRPSRAGFRFGSTRPQFLPAARPRSAPASRRRARHPKESIDDTPADLQREHGERIQDPQRSPDHMRVAGGVGGHRCVRRRPRGAVVVRIAPAGDRKRGRDGHGGRRASRTRTATCWTYSVSTSNSSVARASASGPRITVEAVSPGNATVTVTASDPGRPVGPAELSGHGSETGRRFPGARSRQPR